MHDNTQTLFNINKIYNNILYILYNKNICTLGNNKIDNLYKDNIIMGLTYKCYII